MIRAGCMLLPKDRARQTGEASTVAEEWEDRAACRQAWVDREWFFRTDPSDDVEDETAELARAWQKTYEDYARAKLVCSNCPVARECLTQNLNAEVGVFGGYDEDEREAIRSGRAVPVRVPVPVLPEQTQLVLDVFKYGTDQDDTREVLRLSRAYNVVGLAAHQNALRLRATAKSSERTIASA